MTHAGPGQLEHLQIPPGRVGEEGRGEQALAAPPPVGHDHLAVGDVAAALEGALVEVGEAVDAAEAGLAFVQKRAPRFEGTPPKEPWMPSKL